MYTKNQHVSKHLCNDLPISRGKKTQQARTEAPNRQTFMGLKLLSIWTYICVSCVSLLIFYFYKEIRFLFPFSSLTVDISNHHQAYRLYCMLLTLNKTKFVLCLLEIIFI